MNTLCAIVASVPVKLICKVLIGRLLRTKRLYFFFKHICRRNICHYLPFPLFVSYFSYFLHLLRVFPLYLRTLERDERHELSSSLQTKGLSLRTTVGNFAEAHWIDPGRGCAPGRHDGEEHSQLGRWQSLSLRRQSEEAGRTVPRQKRF